MGHQMYFCAVADPNQRSHCNHHGEGEKTARQPGHCAGTDPASCAFLAGPSTSFWLKNVFAHAQQSLSPQAAQNNASSWCTLSRQRRQASQSRVPCLEKTAAEKLNKNLCISYISGLSAQTRKGRNFCPRIFFNASKFCFCTSISEPVPSKSTRITTKHRASEQAR